MVGAKVAAKVGADALPLRGVGQSKPNFAIEDGLARLSKALQICPQTPKPSRHSREGRSTSGRGFVAGPPLPLTDWSVLPGGLPLPPPPARTSKRPLAPPNKETFSLPGAILGGFNIPRK